MNFFLRILLLLFLLSGCNTAKEAFTLQKKNSTDEFLVEKKNPLVVPPDYRELPKPINEKNEKQKVSNDDIKISLGQNDELIEEDLLNSEPSTVEKSILNQIK